MRQFLLKMTLPLLFMSWFIAGYAQDFYIIGSNVNGHTWELAQPDCKFTNLGNGKYEWRGQVLGTGFKINDGTWANYYNIGSNGNKIIPGEEYYYYEGGDSGNIEFAEFASLGNPVVTFDYRNGTITVKGESSMSTDWFVTGSFCDWSFDYELIQSAEDKNIYICENVPLYASSDRANKLKIVTTGWGEQYGQTELLWNDGYYDAYFRTINELDTEYRLYNNGDGADFDFYGDCNVIWNSQTQTIKIIEAEPGLVKIDWTTLNVKTPGEFADVYLTTFDNNWGSGQYIKVTGTLNERDLKSIKQLTHLKKLDLSEASITELPERFMSGHTYINEISLPSSLSLISSSAFDGCKALKTVNSDNILTVSQSAFDGCIRLSNLNFLNVQSVGSYAFRNCVSLESVSLQNVNEICNKAFYKCYNIKDANISGPVETIQLESFYGCVRLSSLTLPQSLLKIENSAFNGCNLEEINLPENLQYIGGYAFASNKRLSKIELPPRLTNIDDYAFKDCAALAEAILPGSLAWIGHDVFQGTSLQKISCFASYPPMSSSGYSLGLSDYSRLYLYVPSYAISYYRNAYLWKEINLMRPLDAKIDRIDLYMPLTLTVDEETEASIDDNLDIMLRPYSYDNPFVGELSIKGESALNINDFKISSFVGLRKNKDIATPTFINENPNLRANNVVYDMNLKNSNAWYFFSIPYNVKIKDIKWNGDTKFVIRKYDSAARAAGNLTSTWVELSENDELEAGLGYIISATGGQEFITVDNRGYEVKKIVPGIIFESGSHISKNNFFRTDDVTVHLKEYAGEFAHNSSWNHIGNPYPCYYEMKTLADNFSAPITIYNGSNYVTYSPVDDDLVIAPYESFFVQCPVGMSEIKFTTEGRMHDRDGVKQYKTTEQSKEKIAFSDRNVFDFNLATDEYEDRARIVLNENAAIGYEPGVDAAKFFVENGLPQLYVSQECEYSINERPIADGNASLGLKSSSENVCTLSLSGKHSDEWNVYLTDNICGTTINLSKENYTFTSTREHLHNRFAIQFVADVNQETGIKDIERIFADSIVTISDMSGKTIYTGLLGEFKMPAYGVYVIKSENNVLKMVIK